MVDVYGLSDVGCVRELNEDCFCIDGFDENAEKGFCIIADGMGGHNAGEVASQNAVKVMAEELKALSIEESKGLNVPGYLNNAVNKANERVYKMSEENIVHSGMGTTVVAAAISDKTAYIANVGDSRSYAMRGDEFVQITTDHSVVFEMVLSGTITKEEARNHPQKNIITRAVGTDKRVKADVFEYNYLSGDVMILCSDGLSSMVDDTEIAEVIKTTETSEETAKKLVETAKQRGGLDNITVICIRFKQEVLR